MRLLHIHTWASPNHATGILHRWLMVHRHRSRLLHVHPYKTTAILHRWLMIDRLRLLHIHPWASPNHTTGILHRWLMVNRLSLSHGERERRRLWLLHNRLLECNVAAAMPGLSLNDRSRVCGCPALCDRRVGRLETHGRPLHRRRRLIGDLDHRERGCSPKMATKPSERAPTPTALPLGGCLYFDVLDFQFRVGVHGFASGCFTRLGGFSVVCIIRV